MRFFWSNEVDASVNMSKKTVNTPSLFLILFFTLLCSAAHTGEADNEPSFEWLSAETPSACTQNLQDRKYLRLIHFPKKPQAPTYTQFEVATPSQFEMRPQPANDNRWVQIHRSSPENPNLGTYMTVPIRNSPNGPAAYTSIVELEYLLNESSNVLNESLLDPLALIFFLKDRMGLNHFLSEKVVMNFIKRLNGANPFTAKLLLIQAMREELGSFSIRLVVLNSQGVDTHTRFPLSTIK